MNQKRLLLSFIGDGLFFIPHVINPISKNTGKVIRLFTENQIKQLTSNLKFRIFAQSIEIT